jgi:hypothetical protein
MAITLVQSNSANASSPSSLAYSSNNTAGNLLIFTGFNPGSGGTYGVPTDSQGNTWNVAVHDAGSGIFYAMNCRGGANTVTAGFWTSGATAGYAIYEFSGVALTSALDQVAAIVYATWNSSITPTAANELLFAMSYNQNSSGLTSITVGSGWTTSTTFTYTDGAPHYYVGQAGYMVQTTATTENASAWSTSGKQEFLMASFFATAAVDPTVTTQAVSSIGTTTATGNGNITATGGVNPTVEGVMWSTSSFSTPANGTAPSGSYATNSGSYGTGAFTVSMTGLTASTTYYVCAFATNSVGYSWGSVVSFTTSAPPVVPECMMMGIGT